MRCVPSDVFACVWVAGHKTRTLIGACAEEVAEPITSPPNPEMMMHRAIQRRMSQAFPTADVLSTTHRPRSSCLRKRCDADRRSDSSTCWEEISEIMKQESRQEICQQYEASWLETWGFEAPQTDGKHSSRSTSTCLHVSSRSTHSRTDSLCLCQCDVSKKNRVGNHQCCALFTSAAKPFPRAQRTDLHTDQQTETTRGSWALDGSHDRERVAGFPDTSTAQSLQAAHTSSSLSTVRTRSAMNMGCTNLFHSKHNVAKPVMKHHPTPTAVEHTRRNTDEIAEKGQTAHDAKMKSFPCRSSRRQLMQISAITALRSFFFMC